MKETRRAGAGAGADSKRAAARAEAPAHVHVVVVLAGLFVGLQITIDGELRLVRDEVHREGASTLPLAVIAVAHRRGDEIAGQFKGHFTAQTTSCLHVRNVPQGRRPVVPKAAGQLTLMARMMVSTIRSRCRSGSIGPSMGSNMTATAWKRSGPAAPCARNHTSRNVTSRMLLSA